MPALEHGGKLVFFAHVPKSGGTSVEDYLSSAYGPLSLYDRDWHDARLRGERADAHYPCSDQHRSWADALPELARNPDLVFGIVRDPWTRLLSEFKFQKRFRPRHKFVTRLGFSVWLATMEHALRANPYICDNHIRPQTDFLPDEAMVFHLENGLGELERWLSDHLGPPAHSDGMPHSQKDAGRPRRKPHPRRADMRRAMRMYREDYQRFGYAFPDVTTVPRDPFHWMRTLLAKLLAPVFLRRYRENKI